ncbi:TetR family transcriptional regulator [Actinomadura keratinilytica]
MVKQERAIRTRKAILTAAAKIFEERGYRAATISEILSAAGVTKGALYFHFSSKEELAQGILHEQDQWLPIPDRACKIQQLADTVLLHAYRLQHDPLVRAASGSPWTSRRRRSTAGAPSPTGGTSSGTSSERPRRRGRSSPTSPHPRPPTSWWAPSPVSRRCPRS